jgi:hypothetical protein
MPKIALYTSSAVFAAVAVFLATLYVFDTDVILGNTLFRPLNLVGGAVLFALLAVWMMFASLEFRDAELTVSKEPGA